MIELAVSGPVDRFALIRPAVVSLRGYIGEPVKRTVAIQTMPKYPFKITEAKAQDGRFIRFSLQDEFKSGESPEYRLLVENTKQDIGSYSDTIILKTDSDLQPELTLPVYGLLRNRSQPDQQKSIKQ